MIFIYLSIIFTFITSFTHLQSTSNIHIFKVEAIESNFTLHIRHQGKWDEFICDKKKQNIILYSEPVKLFVVAEKDGEIKSKIIFKYKNNKYVLKQIKNYTRKTFIQKIIKKMVRNKY